MNEVEMALAALLERYLRVAGEADAALVEFDPEWLSPCVVGVPDEDGMVAWKAVPMTPTPDFSDVEAVIGETLHPDVKAFYGSYWAGEVQARHGEEAVLLQTIWNPQDLKRTKAALVAHVLTRRKALGGTATVFIANTDSDLFFSVDNASGEVLLEEAGYPPRGVAAPNLTHFLNDLRIGEE